MSGVKKDRTPDEVAAEFAGTRSVMDSRVRVDDDPEPDHARIAGLTREGTTDLDEQIRAVEQEILAESAGDTPAPPPASPAHIDPPAATLENIMKMMVAALGQIAAGQANSAHVAAQALDQAAKQQQPDNKFSHNISDFNPQGDSMYPRPKLKCEMFIPWEAEPESLNFEELELLNLLEDGEFVIKRNDNMKVQVTVKIQMNLNGKPNRLLMNSETAYNDDNHWMMPPLVSILRQVLATRPGTKEAAARVLTMDERVEMVLSGALPVSVGVR